MQTFIISSKDLGKARNKADLILKENKLNKFDIETLEFEKALGIDDVRNIQKKIFLKPFKGEKKAVVIIMRQGATIEAQNSMLKLLEEPPFHAVIVLSTQRKQKLLPTIRSRTVEINASFQKKRLSGNIEFPDRDFGMALTTLSQVENPKEWIDWQIENYYQMLLTAVNKNNPDKIDALLTKIENLSYAKKLIDANVNAKFVLFNLALPASF